MTKYSEWLYLSSLAFSLCSIIFDSVPALIIGLLLALAGITQETMEQ